jgi:hypothetical protein
MKSLKINATFWDGDAQSWQTLIHNFYKNGLIGADSNMAFLIGRNANSVKFYAGIANSTERDQFCLETV